MQFYHTRVARNDGRRELRRGFSKKKNLHRSGAFGKFPSRPRNFPACGLARPPSGEVAQLVEQGTENPCVVGPIPTLATILKPLKTREKPHDFKGFFIFGGFGRFGIFPLIPCANYAHIMPTAFPAYPLNASRSGLDRRRPRPRLRLDLDRRRGPSHSLPRTRPTPPRGEREGSRSRERRLREPEHAQNAPEPSGGILARPGAAPPFLRVPAALDLDRGATALSGAVAASPTLRPCIR